MMLALISCSTKRTLQQYEKTNIVENRDSTNQTQIEENKTIIEWDIDTAGMMPNLLLKMLEEENNDNSKPLPGKGIIKISSSIKKAQASMNLESKKQKEDTKQTKEIIYKTDWKTTAIISFFVIIVCLFVSFRKKIADFAKKIWCLRK